jgi:glycosyltransferase involved in cell wall biosynthesis
MKAAVAGHGLAAEDVTVLGVPHHEVPRYLAAGDIGLLLREPSLVNAVASPVKFAEYLAAGLPVVLTEGIGDYSDLAMRNNLGVVLDFYASEEAVEKNVVEFLMQYETDSTVRARCIELATRELDREMHLARLATLYEKIQGHQTDQRS